MGEGKQIADAASSLAAATASCTAPTQCAELPQLPLLYQHYLGDVRYCTHTHTHMHLEIILKEVLAVLD